MALSNYGLHSVVGQKPTMPEFKVSDAEIDQAQRSSGSIYTREKTRSMLLYKQQQNWETSNAIAINHYRMQEYEMAESKQLEIEMRQEQENSVRLAEESRKRLAAIEAEKAERAHKLQLTMARDMQMSRQNAQRNQATRRGAGATLRNSSTLAEGLGIPGGTLLAENTASSL